MSELVGVSNPYPEWQSPASDTSCWNCYKLLWFKANVEAHLCDNCKQTHVAVEHATHAEVRCVMTESRVNEAGMMFQIGDLVRLRDKSETARIKGFYAVQIGGVFLDEQLDGFNSWREFYVENRFRNTATRRWTKTELDTIGRGVSYRSRKHTSSSY